MATVEKLTRKSINSKRKHPEVDCTYDIIELENGTKILQLDTYGSSTRVMPGKVSQSLRLSKSALKKIVKIALDNDLL